MSTISIIYISSNRENKEFENKIIQDMLNKKNSLPIYLPIYSVTQKPMKLGNNKCVWDVGVSGFNFCRQLQMAVEMAKTDFVISCEADCIYPEDYFTFIPEDKNAVYRNTNNYVIPYKQDACYAKSSQTAFQVAGRDFLLNRLNYLLKDQPQWNTEMKNFPKEIGKPFLESWKTFKTKYACLTIKTGDGMRKQTKHGDDPIRSLPYWGSINSLKEKYL